MFALAGTYLWNYGHMLHLDGPLSNKTPGYYYLGQTWSLALEEQFYWAWPALFLFIGRFNHKRLLGALILIVPMIRMVSYVVEPYVRKELHMMFHTGIDTILVGCFLAMHRQAIEQRLRSILDSRFCLPILLLLIFVVFPHAETTLGGFWIATYGATIEASAIALFMLWILAHPEHPFCGMLRSAPFMFGGTISYSLYLWQQLFTHMDSPVYRLLGSDNGYLRLVVAVIGSICAASFSYYVIERPFLWLKDRKHAVREAAPIASLPLGAIDIRDSGIG